MEVRVGSRLVPALKDAYDDPGHFHLLMLVHSFYKCPGNTTIGFQPKAVRLEDCCANGKLIAGADRLKPAYWA